MLLPSPAAAQTRFQLTAATYASLQAVDTVQTLPCLRSATCRETNPLYTSPARTVAIKAATTGAVLVWAARLRPKHPRLAWFVLGSVTVAQGIFVAQNVRVRRRAT